MLLREFISLLRIAAMAAGLPGSICLPQGRFRPFLSLAARLSPDDPCVPGPEGQERRDAKKTPLPGLQGSWDAPELTAPSSERLFPRGRVRRCLCTVLRSAVSGPSSLCELIQRKTSGVKRSGGESEIGSSAHRVSVNQTRPLVLVKRDWDSIEQMVFFFFPLKLLILESKTCVHVAASVCVHAHPSPPNIHTLLHTHSPSALCKWRRLPSCRLLRTRLLLQCPRPLLLQPLLKPR